MKNDIKVLKKKDTAIIPKQATVGSAGFDLYACIDEPIIVAPSALIKIPTGIAIGIENKDIAGFVFARSGLGIKYGITLSNGVGVIDSDYRGEIQIGLCNLSKKEYTITPNERIAQIVFMPVYMTSLIEVNELPQTDRGENGLGSSGKHVID